MDAACGAQIGNSMVVAAPVAPPVKSALRADVQALRGVAILLVLAHHAHIPGLPGGFLGVDVFFVISGYLMTGLIDRELVDSRFSFARFYARRIRRLLPAAYATLSVTAIAAPLLLDSQEYRAFVAQLAGSFGFVANIILWKQSDYFATAADLKPLLHMWSLAVEEQYYLGLPLVLFVFPARLRWAAMVALLLLSAVLCAVMVSRAPSATFYMLPTRAWELAIGGCIALLVNRGLVSARSAPLIRSAAVAVILIVAVTQGAAGHPGWPALIICLATAVLLVPGSAYSGARAGRLLTLAGDRSYSLYLVHWPLFAFASNIVIDPLSPVWNGALLIASFAVAELQYRFVETPLRSVAVTRRYLMTLILAALSVTSISLWIAREKSNLLAADRVANVGLSEACAAGSTFTPSPACKTAAAPTAILWGDSFAMHLAPGLAASLPGGFVQATKPICGPVIGIAPFGSGLQSEYWAQGCISFNDSVLAYIVSHPQIKTVILSSIWIPYLQQEDRRTWQLVSREAEGEVISGQNPGRVLSALASTVSALRAAGKKVILIGPPPGVDIDYSRCHLRRAQHLFTISAVADCDIDMAIYAKVRSNVRAFLAEVKAQKVVPILSLEEALCPGGSCQTQANGILLYADQAHLSQRGSVVLARQMDWARQIPAMAK